MNSMPLMRRFLLTVLMIGGLWPSSAMAVVAGPAPTLFQQFRLNGDAAITGNTLMVDTCQYVNTVLLSESDGDITNVPGDAELEGAYLFWSASRNTPDTTAILQTPNGRNTNLTSTSCDSVNFFGSAYGCMVDVTNVVEQGQAPGQGYNGTYTVRGVQGTTGVVDNNCNCVDFQSCQTNQARYAGWSLVLVYESPTELTERDIFLYKGFRAIDEDRNTPGSDSFTISGFSVGNPPEARLSFFALEGDRQLGVPPQDLVPPSSFGCPDGSCIDSIAFNNTRLSSSTNPSGNVFNGTVPTGFALGVDLDTFNVSSLVRSGDTSASITITSGDGVANNSDFDNHGWGEYVVVNWLLLRINRLAPNFNTDKTFLDVVPTSVGPGGTVFFTLNITNEGSLTANNVIASLPFPPEIEYVGGSTTVDGVAVPDVGGNSALVNGLRLGTITNTGDNDRRITFQARIRTSVLPGSTVRVGPSAIDANELDNTVFTNDVLINVVGATINRPTKISKDLNGGEYTPEDIVEYEVYVSKQGDEAVGGLAFSDDISPYVQLIEIPSGPFNASASSLNGGPNGTGRISITDINIPAFQEGIFVRYKVRILSTAELVAKGVSPSAINGLAVSNQGVLSAAFLPSPLATDDPNAPGRADPTVFTLSTGVNFTGPTTRKEAVDVNGGQLLPGDTVRFTLVFANEGSEAGTLNVTDDIPAFVENVAILDPRPEIIFGPPPAGSNGTGRLVISSLVVNPGETITVRFEGTVSSAAPNNFALQNVANMSVVEDPAQNRNLTSPTLNVVNAPLFDTATKTVTNLSAGGGFQPGDTVRYTLSFENTGTTTATDVNIQDPVDVTLTNVAVEDGGVYDAASGFITWDLGDVAVGEVRVVHFNAVIGSNVPNGTRIANQAFIQASNAEIFLTDDPGTAANDDTTSFVVVANPLLEPFTKSFLDENGGDVEPGDSILYTISVSNSGRAISTNTVITDVVDPAFASVSPLDGGTYNAGNRTVTWNIGDIPVGDTRTVSFRGTLADVLPDGTTIANQAFGSSTEITEPVPSDDPNTGTNDDPTVIVIDSEAVLASSTKTVQDLNGGAFQPGDVVRYTLTLINEGNAPATSVVVSDVIDASLTDVAPAGGGVFDGTAITWNLASDLVPGTPITLEFDATIASGTASGTVVANQAGVTGGGITGTALTDDPGTAATGDPTQFTVVSQPDFVLSTKSVVNLNGEADFRPGDRIRYTLEITNSGTADATNVTVRDPIDASLTDAVAGQGGAIASGVATWTLATLAAGDTAQLTLEATLVSPLANDTVVSNQAEITSSEVIAAVLTDDPSTPADDDPTEFTVLSIPELDSEKTFIDANGGNVEPGDAITWTITVVNEGTDTARNVVVNDPVDNNLTNVVPSAGGVFAGGSVVWNVGDLAPGERVSLTLDATVVSPLANLTRIENQAQIVREGGAEPVLSDDPGTVDVDDPTGFFVVSAADLTGSTKTASGPGPDGYRPGDTVGYTITLQNSGNANAVDLTVVDTIAPELTNVVPADGGVFDAASRTITWRVRTLNVGETLDIGFAADIVTPLANGTQIANQGLIQSPDFGSDVPTDDPATAADDDPTVIVVTSAPRYSTSTKVAIDEDGDGFFEPGDAVRYDIVVSNDGDADGVNVVVSDPVDGTRLSGVTPLNGGTLAGNTITWTLPTLAAGASSTVSFTAQIATGLANDTPIANQATVTDDDGNTAVSDDPATPDDDDPTVIRVVAEPRLSGLEKRVEDLNGGRVQPGDVVRYTFAITNDGTEAATSVALTDTLDVSNLIDIAITDPRATLSGNTLTWTIGTLAPGASDSLSFEATVRPGVVSGTSITNQASIVADGPIVEVSDDPATPDDDDATVIVVNGDPDLSASTKTVVNVTGGAFLRPGDTIEYTITVENSGFGPAQNVTVIDPIPQNLVNVQVQNGGRVQGNEVIWDGASTPELASLDRGFINLVFTADIAPDTPSGTVIGNQATITEANTGGTRTDNPATPGIDDDATTIEVVYPSIATFEKIVEDLNGGDVQPGDRLQYSLRIVPSDAAPVDLVEVIDVVDANLEIATVLNGGFVDGQTITWNAGTTPELGSVQPGTEVVLSFIAAVRPDVAEGTSIVNVADLSSSTLPEVTPSNVVTVIVGNSLAPEITLTKRVADLNGGDVEAGDVLEYEIVVSNVGEGFATDATFFDSVPSLTTYVAGTAVMNGGRVPDGPGGNSPFVNGFLISPNNQPPGTVPPGARVSLVFRVQVLDDVAAGSQISNQARVVAGGAESTSELVVVTVGGVPRLRFEKTVSWIDEDPTNGDPDVGEQLTYEITVVNEGSREADGLFLTDELPTGTTYVPGFFSVELDGQLIPLTEEEDFDPGAVIGGRVEVGSGPFLPGQRAVVRFRVRADRPGRVENQAQIEGPNVPQQVSDNPATNNIQGDPTVIFIEGDVEGSFLVTKSVEDLNGGLYQVGDEIRYTMTFENLGTERITVAGVDEVPSEIENVNFERRPGTGISRINGNTVNIDNLRLSATNPQTLELSGVVGEVPDGTEICNVIRMATPGGAERQEAEACFFVGQPPREDGVIAGFVAHDIDRDGVFTEADRVLRGWRVDAVPASNPSSAPFASTTSDATGAYALEVPPGEYFLRYYTERGVQFGRVPEEAALPVVGGERTEQSVLVDPQGIVHNSQTGEPLAGIQVFIFYDDEFDTGGLVPPEALLEGANQQGQLTNADGMYRFNVEEGRTYQLVVQLTESQSWQYPSLLTPPELGVFDVSQPASGDTVQVIRMVENSEPDVSPGVLQRYFLRFFIGAGGSRVPDGVVNNHIPLDPIQSLITLDKRVDRPSASIGDVLTYTVTVQNRSDRDIIFDVTGGDGLSPFDGAFIQDVFPPQGAFSYVDGSARATLVVGDERRDFEVEIDTAASTTGTAIKRFGRRFGGRVVGFDLPAGGQLELKYRAVVTTQAEPHESYRNVATLLGKGDVPLSEADSALVRIIPDPIFDQGVMIGKAFCDADGDGFQDAGESGVEHVKVVLDTGYYAYTDVHGKYHFHDVDPGSHMIKVDVGTLPPGGTLTSAESRIVYMTRGLPAKVNFGIQCPAANVVELTDVAVSDDVRKAAEDEVRARFLHVEGDFTSWTTRIEGEGFDLMKPVVYATLTEAGVQPETPVTTTLTASGLTEPVVFNMVMAQGPAPSAWKLVVVDHERDRVVRTFEGVGMPPAQLSWDGTALSGQTQALEGGRFYRYYLDALGEQDDFGRSAMGIFAVAGAEKEVVDEVFADELMGELWDGVDPTPLLGEVLTENPGIFTLAPNEKLVIEAHTDDELDPIDAFMLTEEQVTAVAGYLESRNLLPPEEQLTLAAQGSDAPLLPNLDEESRLTNRRIVLRKVREATGGAVDQIPEIASYERTGTINDYPVPFTDLDFDVLVPRPADGLLVIDLRDETGARAIKAVRIEVEEVVPEAAAPQVPARVDPAAGVVTVADAETKLTLKGAQVIVSQKVFRIEGGLLASGVPFNFEIPSDASVRGWILEVRNTLTNSLVYRVSDDGKAPPRIRWSGSTRDSAPLLTGVYEVRLTLLGAGASRLLSAPTYFAIAEVEEEPEPLPLAAPEPVQLRVNGRQVEAGADGSFDFTVEGYTEEAFLVDLDLEDGSRLIEAITIPAGFERRLGDAPEPEAVKPDVEGEETPPEDGTDEAQPEEDVEESEEDVEESEEEGDVQPEESAGVSPSAIPRSTTAIRAVPKDQIRLPDRQGYRPLRGVRIGVRPTSRSPRFRVLMASEIETAQEEPVEDGEETPPETEGEGTEVSPETEGEQPETEAEDASETGEETPPEEETTGEGGSEGDLEGFGGAALDAALEEGSGEANDVVIVSDPELEAFGADALEAALYAEGLVDLQALRQKANAGQLKVVLPPADMKLARNSLLVRGVTHPENVVTVNGEAAKVAADGSFRKVVELPDGASTLLIETADGEGNTGRLEWPVEVETVQYFLMAFGDSAVGLNGAELAGETPHNHFTTDGGVLLYGQARLYFKGHMKGSELGTEFFEAYDATVHVDTGKMAEFEEMFATLIQPEEYYPVYGDSSEEVQEVNARGKLYLMVEADETYLKFANFRTDMKGIELFDYARTFYGLDAAFNKTFTMTTDDGDELDFDTHARVYVAGDSFLGDGQARMRHTYNYMRGTGGSLYYLENDNVLEGSEQIALVVRDRVTGAELARLPQSRNIDYTVRYVEGRVMFKGPIPSVADASFLTGGRLTTRDTYAGHPVFVEASYEYEVRNEAAQTSWGAQVRETMLDGKLSIGAGFVDEGRGGSLAGSNYQLMGVDAAYRHSSATFIEAEYARSRSFDAFAVLSEDGGLTYSGLQRRTGVDDVGNAVHVKGQLEVADLMGEDFERSRFISAGGYFDMADTGFYSNRNAMDRGTMRFGFNAAWNITDEHALVFTHDTINSEIDDLVVANPEALKRLDRSVTRFAYDYQSADYAAGVEYNYGFYDDHFEEDGLGQHTIAGKFEYLGIQDLRIGITQEVIAAADDERTVSEFGDRFTTGITLSWQILDDLALEATERVRWNGENSTRLGVRSSVGDGTSTYLQQRFTNRKGGDGFATSTVVGGEQTFGEDDSGRAFGEYQLEGGISGQRNRAVMGLGKRWDVARGVVMDTAYERSQIFGNGGSADSSRDVVSVGWQLTRWESFKASSRFEFRYDQGDSSQPQTDPCLTNGVLDNPGFCKDLAVGGFDKYQVVSLNAIDWKWTESLTFLARYNLAMTQNLTLDTLESIDQELSVGFALRPVDYDLVNILFKYTYLDEQRPLGLAGYDVARTQKHVVSLVPILELPYDLQIVSKFAWKHVISDAGPFTNQMPQVVTDTLLFILRLNYHLWKMTDELGLDIGAEYRVLKQFDPDEVEHGALFDVSVSIIDHFRVGVGYNFTSFSDNEFVDNDQDAHGFFFRLQTWY